MAFSRVYTGVHYPGDVLVGVATGAVLGRLASRLGRAGGQPLTACPTMGAMTAPTLVGPRVTLRAYRDDDRVARQRHGWHREIERGYGDDTPTRAMTDDEVEAWAGYLAAKTRAGAVCWAVEVDGELVGHAFLFDVREGGRKARLALGMYAPQFIGRGLGTETIRLMLRHAFGTLGCTGST